MKTVHHELLDFNIDRYLNPYIPRNRLDRLPKPISHFLGVRSEAQPDPPAVIRWCWSFIGALCGILLVGATTKYAAGLVEYNPPVIIASLGASAILDYNAIRSPLAQPRNAIIGHALCAVVGVAISKLFQLRSDFEDVQWVSGAFGCAAASIVMSATNTVHPPGGATALLASTDSIVIAMGWMFVPFILLGIALTISFAFLVNNIQRQYPTYWWTAEPVGNDVRPKDVEKASSVSSERTLHKQHSNVEYINDASTIAITAEHVVLPTRIQLNEDEAFMLETLQARLQNEHNPSVVS